MSCYKNGANIWAQNRIREMTAQGQTATQISNQLMIKLSAVESFMSRAEKPAEPAKRTRAKRSKPEPKVVESELPAPPPIE